MRREELVAHCLGEAGGRAIPGGEAELVATVGGKAFAIIGRDSGTVGVECGRDAAEAAEWTGPVPGDEVRELVDASYDTIVAALPWSRRPTTA